MNHQAREIERRLGEAYAQNLRDNPSTESIYKDCKETIQSSLSVLEHYNKIALAMKGVIAQERPVPVPISMPAN
ncbi:hypothetical protein [Vampirovibrio sp.]|uniref:hypothetical protein n=1 Tax=Vampirovibrio sp. TaxID=2717857 RepID=UPI00359384BF